MKYSAKIESDRTGVQTTIEVDLREGGSVIEAIVNSGQVPDYAWNLIDVTLVGDADPLLEADPRFPHRPHTLDFARLSGAVSKQDAIADMLGQKEAIECDMDSLLYLANFRINAVAPRGAWHKPAVMALYLDAFQLGVEFTNRGGHRPTEARTAGEGGSL